MPTGPASPEAGVPTTNPESVQPNPSADGLRADLEAMAEAQKPHAAASPEASMASATTPQAEAASSATGRFEAVGASVGSRIDALIDRGQEKVENGRVKARSAKERMDARVAIVREKIKSGGEAAAEKKQAAISLAKEKSRDAMLLSIGVYEKTGDAILQSAERAQERGKKLGESLNRWAAKKLTSLVKGIFRAKESVTKAIGSTAEKVGNATEKAVNKVDKIGKEWEARLQEARKEADEAAEKARVDAMTKEYIEARIASATEAADAVRNKTVEAAGGDRDEEIKAAENKYSKKVREAEDVRDSTVAAAERAAASEVANLTSHQIEAAMTALAHGSAQDLTPGVEGTTEAGSFPSFSAGTPAEQPAATAA